jgi:hypothetical protein
MDHPLTPGFSPVPTGQECQNRFNGFSRARKPLKRLGWPNAFNTQLKPGVNESDERSHVVAHFLRINRV